MQIPSLSLTMVKLLALTISVQILTRIPSEAGFEACYMVDINPDVMLKHYLGCENRGRNPIACSHLLPVSPTLKVL